MKVRMISEGKTEKLTSEMKLNLAKMRNDGSTQHELAFTVKLSNELFVIYFTA